MSEVDAGKNNRNSILHEMRSRAGILDSKVGKRMTPLVQNIIYCHPDFTHMGVSVASHKVMTLLHDRSCLQLDLMMFSSANLETRV